MKSNKPAAGVLLAAARSALICCGVYLLALRNGGAGNIYPLSLVPYAVAAFLYNRLLLRKDRTVAALVWFDLALCAAYFLAVSFLQPWGSIRQAIAAFIVTGALTAAEAKDNLKPIGLHDVIITVDASFLSLAVSMAVLFGIEYSAQWALCAIVGAVSAFAALLDYRLDCINRAGRIGVLSVGAGAGLVITLAASQKIASSVGKAIVAVWNIVLSVLGFIADLLERFFLWLASFAPEIEGDIEIDPTEGINLPAEEAVQTGFDPTWLFCVLLVCAAAVLFIYLIRRKTRLTAHGRVSATKVSSESVGLRFALKRLFEKLRNALRLARALKRKRRTPAGIYLRVSKCAVRPQSCETAKEYLLRLAAHECVDTSESAALAELADAVNRQLYSLSGDEVFRRFNELRFFRARLGLRIAEKKLLTAFSRKQAATSHR